MKYQRGQIYYYNFDADGSHITNKSRPVVIVSHDIENENDNFDRMTVVPLTRTVTKVFSRSECKLICNQTLSKAQVDMITTVKKALVLDYLDQLTRDD
ncbi:type II toxin-antitoxin system PemK/MazF family toxin, partial [Solemya velum gill symbiont]